LVSAILKKSALAASPFIAGAARLLYNYRTFAEWPVRANPDGGRDAGSYAEPEYPGRFLEYRP